MSRRRNGSPSRDRAALPFGPKRAESGFRCRDCDKRIPRNRIYCVDHSAYAKKAREGLIMLERREAFDRYLEENRFQRQR